MWDMVPCWSMSQGAQRSGIEDRCSRVEVRMIHPSDQTWEQRWVSLPSTDLVLDALYGGCQLPAASIKLSSLAAGRAPDASCFAPGWWCFLLAALRTHEPGAQVQRLRSGQKNVRRSSRNRAGLDRGAAGSPWWCLPLVWHSYGSRAEPHVSTRTSFHFQGPALGTVTCWQTYGFVPVPFCLRRLQLSSPAPFPSSEVRSGMQLNTPERGLGVLKVIILRRSPQEPSPQGDALLIL